MSEMHGSEASLEFDLQDRLSKALRVAGMKPGEMADVLGVHRNTVSNYMSGRTPVERRTLIAWAFATGVPLEWLEHGVRNTPGPGGGGGEPKPATSAALDALTRQKLHRQRRAGSTERYLTSPAAAA